MGLEVPSRGQLIRRCSTARSAGSSTTFSMSPPRRWTSAPDAAALGLPRTRKLMVFGERARGFGCTPTISARAASARIFPPKLVDDIGDWADAFPPYLMKTSRADHRQPHLQAAQRRHRQCHKARPAFDWGSPA